MKQHERVVWALWAGLLLAGLGVAQTTPPAQAPPLSADEAAEIVPEGQIEEVIVVTASRTEEKLHDAPATVSVLTAADIAEIPADDAGDLLRNVPGLNVMQMSARDVQVAGRESTNTLATGQLVLLDGRTLFLDFFDFVAWDFVPLDFAELKQIEVVRGPGSAVWGANAISGVINLITKSPKELAGTAITVGGGELGTKFGRVAFAGVAGKLGYKVSGAYYEQDPYERPTGVIPGSKPTATYEFYGLTNANNQGTTQPKVDLRFDYDTAEDSTLIFGAGWAGTDGIVNSGIGPFDMKKNTSLAYGKLDWNVKTFHLDAFYNRLDGEATNLFARSPATGKFLNFIFETDTYNLDLNNTNVLGGHHILTYGANVRHNKFNVTIDDPADTTRKEYGVYAQDEMLIGNSVRWLVGGRYDHLDPIGSVVSPRTALMYSFSPNQTLRTSYGRAFRSPSVVNNYISTSFVTPIQLAPGLIFPLVVSARGNADLDVERTDSFDFGYVGTFGTSTVTAAIYHNKQKDLIDFYVAQYYSSTVPPPGWPLPPAFVPPNTLPRLYSYRNVGEIVNEGVELSYNWRQTGPWSMFMNASYQKEPEVRGVAKEEIGRAPKTRANAGLAYDAKGFFFNANVNYQDKAYWADVLSITGTTKAFTMFNASIGYHLWDGKMTLSVIGQNVTDERVQQHLFGDIISRKVTGQIALRF